MELDEFMDLRPALEQEILRLIDRHAVLGRIAEIDKQNAAHLAAWEILAELRAATVVGEL